VLSKAGFCSRAQACTFIREGRVRVNGRCCRDPQVEVTLERDQVEVDGVRVQPISKVYLMVNKPRGLVSTRADEQGRATIYQCLGPGQEGPSNVDGNILPARPSALPWVSPVGRLDRASEGLILFTNDTLWADRILSPSQHVDKTYHVQVDCMADEALCQRLRQGTTSNAADSLAARKAALLRQGTRNSWIEIVLDEGKNRQIRRLLEFYGIQVLRLVRVAIGPLVLGNLPKGQYRHLTRAEVHALAAPSER
jgi:23S rRNA pseudouridine2605 synthase